MIRASPSEQGAVRNGLGAPRASSRRAVLTWAPTTVKHRGRRTMRTLRVVGLHEDGKSIVCEDPASRTRFLLPADERLRAAARGDITRLGQIEIELESQMRPRESQQRIRAGESVERGGGGGRGVARVAPA